jgi:hypothetical protein
LARRSRPPDKAIMPGRLSAGDVSARSNATNLDQQTMRRLRKWSAEVKDRNLKKRLERSLKKELVSEETSYTRDIPSPEAAAALGLRMEEMETIHAFARRKGLTRAQLEEAVDQWLAANGEVTARTTAKSRPDTPQRWPTERWENSPERGSRKPGALFAYLRRVWKPFLDETQALVTRRILAEIDAPAEAALKSALRSGPLPRDIGIVATKEIKQTSERPAVFKSPGMPDMQ